jgi:hypothetical protein
MTFFQFGISLLLGWLLIIQSTSLSGRNICHKYYLGFPYLIEGEEMLIFSSSNWCSIDSIF